MPKIAYVGKKHDGETAFFHDTKGIVWYPRAVHEITDVALASKMLVHQDVFAKAAADAELSAGFPGGHPDDQPNIVPVVAIARREPAPSDADGKPLTGMALRMAQATQDQPEDADDVQTLIPGAEQPQASEQTSEQTPEAVDQPAAEISLAPGSIVAPIQTPEAPAAPKAIAKAKAKR